MLLQITNLTKSVFDKQLYDKLNLIIEKGEKSALIGQNGVGKTTLFKILIGEEKDFEGKIELASGTRIEITQQEHLRKDFTEKKTAIEYILDSVPSYNKLKKILNEYSNGDEVTEEYLSALADFTDMNYFNIEDEIASMLEGFQITLDKALSPMLSLSGGEKRFVELTKVIFSNADLILIDEPTNHLDYIGKEVFLDWLKSTKKTVLIITHDRDVLKEVSKIYELKNHIITHFNGNYTAYLKQNLHTTLSQLNKYETDLAKIEKLKKQADDAYLKKLTAKSDKGRLRAKILEERMKREYKKVVENMHKPSFWIDTENEGMIDKKIKESYSKYKSKNINLSGSNFAENKNIKKLFSVRDFVIGYDKPLFKEISFDFFSGMRLQLIGRNGAGKSSFIKYLLSLIVHEYPNENSLYQELIDTKSDLKKYYGEIEIKNNIKVGIYEQEVSEKYINMTLFNAIRQILIESNIPVNPTVINALMKQYLFNEKIYESAFMYELSGGEKARFQIMRALLNKPGLLILDEPTNHLDLPSIEILEGFLKDFKGGIIFVSHDSFFSQAIRADIAINIGI